MDTKPHMKKIVIGLAVLVVALGVTAFYFYKHAKSVANPTLTAQVEAKALAEKVGKLIILPTDEVPTIATVSDPAALKDQSFFNGAKKGDKVLIYTNAKKAILYDPVVNKIVTVAPLNIGDQKSGALDTSPNTAPSTTQKSNSSSLKDKTSF